MQVTALGAVVGLILAIVLIIRGVHPVYGLILGAVVGGLVGGAGLGGTVSLMIAGAQNIMSAVLRILTVGVLAGVLIESGAATQIAETIVTRVGESKSLIALALATFVLTAVGVFIDVAVITVAPIALAIAFRTKLSKPAILLAMIGGGKAGNIISPNPNTIAASGAFELPLTSVMAAGIIQAIFGLIVTVILTRTLIKKGIMLRKRRSRSQPRKNPAFLLRSLDRWQLFCCWP